MTRDVGAVLLVLFGGAITRIAATDAYLQYVRVGMRPWLLLAGLTLVGLGVSLVVDAIRTSVRNELGAASAGEVSLHGGHVHAITRVGWLLLVPILTIFLVAPPALGAFTASRAQAVVIPPSDPVAPPPLPAGSPVDVYLSDFAARAVWDDGRTLAGRGVRMVGFVTPEKSGQGWFLTRLSITCCAADALTVKVKAVGAPQNPAANTWLSVVGEWTPGGGTQSESAVPWLTVKTMTKIVVPENAYE